MSVESCKPCHGSGIIWVVEEPGQGTGEIWTSSFDKNDPANGRRIRKGWYEICNICHGEGLKKGVRTAKPVSWETGMSLSMHAHLFPKDFGLNTRENAAWKMGDCVKGNDENRISAHGNESVWLASNGMLLIVHGDYDNWPKIMGRSEVRGTPAVEAKYYAWLNQGTFTGPLVPFLKEALEEWNALSQAKVGEAVK